MLVDRRGLISVAPLAAYAALTSAASATDIAGRLDAILRRDMGQYHLRSVLFGAWIGDRKLHTAAIGQSLWREPVQLDMHFRAAVVTTTYLCALLLHLVDRGRLSLDDRLATWLPDLPKARQVTLRMLADNSSGYGDYLASKPFEGFTRQAMLRHWTAAELIRLGTRLPMAFRPGEGFHYAHTNAVILGEALIRATGLPLPRLLHQAFLGPLELHDSEYPDSTAIRRPVLRAFSSEFGAYEDCTYWDPAWVSHSGLMNSNLRDVARWTRLLGSGAILSKRSYAALTAPTNVGRNGNEADLYYGMGVIVANGWITQNGRYFGWNPVMAYLPSQQLTIVINATAGPKAEDVSNGVRILKHVVEVLAPGHLLPDRYK